MLPAKKAFPLTEIGGVLLAADSANSANGTKRPQTNILTTASILVARNCSDTDYVKSDDEAPSISELILLGFKAYEIDGPTLAQMITVRNT